MSSEKAKSKKEYIKRVIAQGDKRSYNQIQADLELFLWNERFKGINEVVPNIETEKTEEKTDES